MNEKNKEIISECQREEENCLYTSTTLYYWLKDLIFMKGCFIVLPIIFGGFAGMKVLGGSDLSGSKYVIAIATMLSGILPSIYSGLQLDSTIKEVKTYASKYKILQGEFRRLQKIYSSDLEFEKLFRKAVSELNDVKAASLVPADKFFKKAQKKIKKGNYSFDLDK